MGIKRKQRLMLMVAAAFVALATVSQRAQAGSPGPVLPDMVDRDIVKAIDGGLSYLKDKQRTDGSLRSTGFQGTYPSVMTSLAGIAFMAGGSTPESGPYARQVSRAMHYLLRIAEANKSDGLIAGPGGEGQSMYGHGFAMLFLAQCYGVDVSTETSKRIKEVLRRAIKLTAESQSNLGANGGGWYYTPATRSDEGSVTVTQLQALRACRNAGITVPKSTIDKTVKYLQFCQQADGGICYSSNSRGSSMPAISAAAIACFYAAGVYDPTAGGTGKEAKMVENLVRYLKNGMGNNPVGFGQGHWYYVHFYLAQAWYQRGGEDWKSYYPKMAQELLRRKGGDNSWNGDGVGNIFGTAIATTILQLPYGYLPICQR